MEGLRPPPRARALARRRVRQRALVLLRQPARRPCSTRRRDPSDVALRSPRVPQDHPRARRLHGSARPSRRPPKTKNKLRPRCRPLSRVRRRSCSGFASWPPSTAPVPCTAGASTRSGWTRAARPWLLSTSASRMPVSCRRACSAWRGRPATAVSSRAWFASVSGATATSQVLWSAPRLICIADGYTRYGLHAVRRHRRSIDLLRYRFYGDHPIALETVASVTGQAKPAPRTPRRRPAAGERSAGEKGAAWDRPFDGRAGTRRWNARSSAGSPISEIGELSLRFRPPTGRRPPARQTPRRSRPMGRPFYRPAPATATTEEQVYQPEGFAVPMARVTAISMTTRFGLTRGVLYRSVYRRLASATEAGSSLITAVPSKVHQRRPSA